MSTTALTLDEIHQLARTCLMKNGADDANATAIADTVTAAEKDGSVSHGLFRIPGYVGSLKSGKVNGAADPQMTEVTPVIFRCHGDHGYAPLALQRATAPLAKAAQKYGIAALALTHSFHFAALWHEVEALAEEGLMAMSGVSYIPVVAPAGGKTPIFGTNPFAYAWPRPGKSPVVLDMATSAMARGEVMIAARDGHEVPAGTGLGPDGEETTDPAAILEGVMLPFGGYKGSNIALMVELMSGPLVGEMFSYEAHAQDNNDGGPARGGQVLIAVSPDLLSGDGWASQCETFFEKYEGIDGARLPGARRHINRKDNGPRQVNSRLVEEIRQLAIA